MSPKAPPSVDFSVSDCVDGRRTSKARKPPDSKSTKKSYTDLLEPGNRMAEWKQKQIGVGVIVGV